jgi:beta-lactamase regulating signal transducer with metallopeptidase domain
MGDPARLLVTNAGAAGLIALLAWAASRVVRRNALVHGLWLLALVKLVTPPIAPVPLLPAWTGLPPLLSRPSPTVVVIPAPRAAEGLVQPMPSEVEPSLVRPSVGIRPATSPTDLRLADATTSRPATPSPPTDWRTPAWAVLAMGAMAIALLAAWRFARFGRLLACARPAPPPVAARSSALAARIGLRHIPPVLLVPARVPPMLWPGRGGPQLFLPEGLVSDLRADELDALLAHELAHVRRRDHWVRLVEIAATALFWWYPVMWWARRALRRAEERCCDEWVLRVLPRSAEAYARGLLKSLTFVAERPLPAVASGLGPADDLEARLKEILMTRPVPHLAVHVRLALAAAATLGLAVFPTHAHPSAAKSDDPPTAAPAATSATAETPAPAAKPAPRARPAPAAKAAAPATPPRAATPSVPAAVAEGVPGGVTGGMPGGVAGGVQGGMTPLPAPAPPPGSAPLGPPTPPPAMVPLAPPVAAPATLTATPALAPMPPLGPTPQASAPAGAAPGARDAARRALDDKRRTIEEKRRLLHQQELELAQKQVELEAQVQEADLRAMADRLRAEGRAAEAARVEGQVKLNAQQLELKKRQLQLEAERAELEASLEAELHAPQDRLEVVEEGVREREAALAHRAVNAHLEAEQELQEQHAIQAELAEAEKRSEAVAAEGQVKAVHKATEELARSLARQIEALEQAGAEAPAHKAEFDRAIQRLKAALDALER